MEIVQVVVTYFNSLNVRIARGISDVSETNLLPVFSATVLAGTF